MKQWWEGSETCTMENLEEASFSFEEDHPHLFTFKNVRAFIPHPPLTIQILPPLICFSRSNFEELRIYKHIPIPTVSSSVLSLSSYQVSLNVFSPHPNSNFSSTSLITNKYHPIHSSNIPHTCQICLRNR